MNVLSFGEILWDIIEGQEHLGGAPFNFAAHASQCGATAFMLSSVGTDSLGKRAYDSCSALGVNNIYLQTDARHATGIVDVTLTNGQPDYFIRENAAFDFIRFEEWRAVYQMPCEVFYFGSLAQRNGPSEETLYRILDSETFTHVFYDVNLRKRCYSSLTIKRSIPYCNILKLNTDELPLVSDMIFGSALPPVEFCQRLSRENKKLDVIVITAADKGSYIFYRNELVHIPGVAVTVVDAVGAGDAFSAAFMTIFSATGDAHKAATIANQVGAFVAGHRGAVPPYSAAIKKLLG